MCGKKSTNSSGVSQIKMFEDQCPDSSWRTVKEKTTGDDVDAKKGAGGGTWRICYKTTTPGSKNMYFTNTNTCGNDPAISYANDDDGPSYELMKGLGGKKVYVCAQY
jgi:hypothetical protein